MATQPSHRGQPSEVTDLLRRWSGDDGDALDQLVPLLYEELRSLARSHMRREHGNWTLGTTELVHEAYFQLSGSDGTPAFEDRAHFFGVVSRVMRRVLIWRARARKAEKRGGGKRPEDLEAGARAAAVEEDLDRMLSVDTALQEMELLEPRWVRVVECRYFTGLTIPETAEALGISPATVKRDWEGARAWLAQRLAP